METSTTEPRSPSEAAASLKRALVGRLAQEKRFRLMVAVTLASLGIALLFFPSLAIFSPPLLIGALIALLLYLNARESLQAAQARKWTTPTPWASRFKEMTPRPHQDAAVTDTAETSNPSHGRS